MSGLDKRRSSTIPSILRPWSRLRLDSSRDFDREQVYRSRPWLAHRNLHGLFQFHLIQETGGPRGTMADSRFDLERRSIAAAEPVNHRSLFILCTTLPAGPRVPRANPRGGLESESAIFGSPEAGSRLIVSRSRAGSLGSAYQPARF